MKDENLTKGNFIDISNAIIDRVDEYDITITGKNMSGKSELLYYLIKKLRKKKANSEVYFIDTVNRYFNIKPLEGLSLSKNDELRTLMGDIQSIVDRRLIPKYLNKIDTFAGGEHSIGAFYSFQYLKNKLVQEDYLSKINHFIENFDIRIEYANEADELIIIKNDYHVNASSGFQAILRLFVEFDYANDLGAKYIIIDEIDNHFDNYICSNIIPILKETFVNIKIITTVHSLNFFENLYENKIFVIKDDLFNYNIIDARDISSYEYINRVVFNNASQKRKKTEIEKIFVKVLNGLEISSKELNYINKEDLSPKDKILVSSIKQAIKIYD